MRLSVAAFLILIAAAPPAVAEEYSGGDWRGRSMVNDTTGNFEGCLVKRENDAGEKVSFFLYFDTRTAVGRVSFIASISSRSLRLIRDKLYPGGILVDWNGIGTEKGVTAIATDTVVFVLPYEHKTFKILGKGSTIIAAVSGESMSFSLNGSARALEWLKACTQRGIDDFARSYKQSDASAPEVKNITAEMMAMILDQAGLTDYEMTPRAESKSVKHGWRWREVAGMQFHLLKGGDDFDALYADAAGYLSGNCVELPGLRKANANFSNGSTYGRRGYNCHDEQGLYRYAMIMIDDRNRVIVFMQFGRDAGMVEDADRRVFSVLENLFEQGGLP